MNASKKETESSRRSLFEVPNDDKSVQEKINDGLLYSEEYIQQVITEVKDWEEHLRRHIEDDNKVYLKEKKRLKRQIFDENVLSPEQSKFLASVNFDKYITQGNKFLTKTSIQLQMDQNHSLLLKLNAIQHKIIEEVFNAKNI